MPRPRPGAWARGSVGALFVLLLGGGCASRELRNTNSFNGNIPMRYAVAEPAASTSPPEPDPGAEGLAERWAELFQRLSDDPQSQALLSRLFSGHPVRVEVVPRERSAELMCAPPARVGSVVFRVFDREAPTVVGGGEADGPSGAARAGVLLLRRCDVAFAALEVEVQSARAADGERRPPEDASRGALDAAFEDMARMMPLAHEALLLSVEELLTRAAPGRRVAEIGLVGADLDQVRDPQERATLLEARGFARDDVERRIEEYVSGVRWSSP